MSKPSSSDAAARSGADHGPATILLLIGLLVLASACGPADDGEPEVPDTIDIGAAADSNLRPQDDQQAEAREVVSLGVVPGDFPEDVWVYQPATVMDFSDRAADQRYVVLRAPERLPTVDARLQRELSERGWSLASAAGNSTTWSKDDRRVSIELQEQGADTLIRIVY